MPRNHRYARFDEYGVYTCTICGKRTRNTGAGAEVGLCRKCYIEAEQENRIGDTAPLEPDCPACDGPANQLGILGNLMHYRCQTAG